MSKELQEQFKKETGKDAIVYPAAHGEVGYASWDYQLWLEGKLTTPPAIQFCINHLRLLKEQGLGLYCNSIIENVIGKLSAPVSSYAPGKNKPFITANVKEILNQYLTNNNEKGISFSRLIELLNEVAEKYYTSPPLGEVSKWIPESIKLLLVTAIKDAENKYEAAKADADWHNNNVPNVGITVDYRTYDPLPAWVEEARTFINSLNLKK